MKDVTVVQRKPWALEMGMDLIVGRASAFAAIFSTLCIIICHQVTKASTHGIDSQFAEHERSGSDRVTCGRTLS